MYDKALAFLNDNIHDVKDIQELNAVLGKGGYARMAFCGKPECEDEIKAITNGGSARVIYQELPSDTELRCPVCGEKAKIIAYFAKAY